MLHNQHLKMPVRASRSCPFNLLSLMFTLACTQLGCNKLFLWYIRIPWGPWAAETRWVKFGHCASPLSQIWIYSWLVLLAATIRKAKEVIWKAEEKDVMDVETVGNDGWSCSLSGQAVSKECIWKNRFSCALNVLSRNKLLL